MAKQNKFKEFFKGYGEIFRSCYDDLANGYFDDGIEFIQHFLAWVGTAGLVMGTVTAIGAGAVLPAVLLGLGSAALATDEAVQMINERPSVIVSSLTKIITAIMAPPLLLVGYPIAVAGAAISNSIKEHREERRERRAAKMAKENIDYTREYDPSISHEPEQNTPSEHTPLADTPNVTRPDFSNYYMESEPRPSSGEYIEELEDPDFNSKASQGPTNDDDILNVD